MYLLYESGFFNVWLDVKSAKGHRVLIQSYPGGIQSGLDYYLNDAGILVSETTIAQTRFDVKGVPLASRIRQAMQYADSIDQAVDILKKNNNGLYTNEWLLADTKTNEIAMFELGTYKTRLWRSSKNEWFGGTEGFYWGCNNTKDLAVRLETIDERGEAGRPGSAVFHPSDRDLKWLELYDKHKGKIDAEFGKLAFTTPPIAAYHSLDAKFTTTDMAKELKSWALFGPPLGRTWQPTLEERKNFPEIEPLVGNPWVVLHAGAPTADKPTGRRRGRSARPGERTPFPKADDKAKEEQNGPETPGRSGTARCCRRPTPTTGWRRPSAITSASPHWTTLSRSRRRRLDAGGPRRPGGAAVWQPSGADYNLEKRQGTCDRRRHARNDTKSDLRQSDWYRVASGGKACCYCTTSGAAAGAWINSTPCAGPIRPPTTGASRQRRSEFQTRQSSTIPRPGRQQGRCDALVLPRLGFPPRPSAVTVSPKPSLGKVQRIRLPGKHYDLALDLQVENKGAWIVR